jgi:Uma2 family endonuclease
VDGQLVERNVEEIGHGDAQGRAYAYILMNGRGFWPGVEIRVQVRAERCCVPDVVVIRGGRPAGRVITSPPEVVLEVLSPLDRAGEVQEKIDEYLQFGVAAMWIIDPERRRGWIHTREGSREASERVLRNVAGDLEVPLSAVFPELT